MTTLIFGVKFVQFATYRKSGYFHWKNFVGSMSYENILT